MKSKIDEAWEKADKFVLNHFEYIGKLTFEKAIKELLIEFMGIDDLREFYKHISKSQNVTISIPTKKIFAILNSEIE